MYSRFIIEGDKVTFMVSLPMAGKTDDEIQSAIEVKRKMLESEGHDVVDAFISEEPEDLKNSGLFYLGYSLFTMTKCDAVYFCKEWEKARGCRIEHSAAVDYGLICRYEN